MAIGSNLFKLSAIVRSIRNLSLLVAAMLLCSVLFGNWMFGGIFIDLVDKGNVGAARFLLTVYPSFVDMQYTTDPGYDIPRDSMLMVAVRNNNKKMTELLIQRGANVRYKDFSDTTALHYAAAWAQPSIVELLLIRGANPNAREKTGETPVSYAIAEGRIGIVALLRRYGAKDAPTIYEAAAFGYIADIEAHLDNHPELLDKPGYREWPPLIYAARNGRAETVKYLLKCDAKLHPRTLHFAVESGSVSTVDVLLDKGADVNSIDPEMNETGIYTAASCGDSNMVSYLISRGADVTITSHGKTPLQTAKQNGHEGVARVIHKALD